MKIFAIARGPATSSRTAPQCARTLAASSITLSIAHSVTLIAALLGIAPFAAARTPTDAPHQLFAEADLHYVAALKPIMARTLILAGVGDLLNAEPTAGEATRLIPGANFSSINPANVVEHSAAGGITAPKNDDQSRKIVTLLYSLPAR